MKRPLFIVIAACALASTAFALPDTSARVGAEAGARPYLENWVLKSLGEMKKVKAGTTRAELLKVFEEEGGLSNRRQRTYVYRECRYFKVDVKFEPVGGAEDARAEAPGDRVVEVSKPYLDYAVVD